MKSVAHMAALLLTVTLLASPAFGANLYSLRFEVREIRPRFAFDISILHTATGRTILRSTLRTTPGQPGTLETTHQGRRIRVRATGETNGYAALVLEVTERGAVVQSQTYHYTEHAAAPPTRYRGEKISLHLREADLRDVLLAIAALTHTSMALDPGVSGTVTLDLVDVPWDQALDLILRQHGLTRKVEGKAHFITR